MASTRSAATASSAPFRPLLPVNPTAAMLKSAKAVATVLSNGTAAIDTRLKAIKNTLKTARMTAPAMDALLAEQSALRLGRNGGDKLSHRLRELQKQIMVGNFSPEMSARHDAEYGLLNAVLSRVEVFWNRAAAIKNDKNPTRSEGIEGDVSKTLYRGADAARARLRAIAQIADVATFTPDAAANIGAEQSALALSLTGTKSIKRRIDEIFEALRILRAPNAYIRHPNETPLLLELDVLQAVTKSYAKMIG